MTKIKKGFESDHNDQQIMEQSINEKETEPPKKGPISFLSGAITGVTLSWLCLNLSKRIVFYFSEHSPSYSSPIAQSVASGFKTLIIGVSFLATFSFGFIGLGLSIVFVKSLFEVLNQNND